MGVEVGRVKASLRLRAPSVLELAASLTLVLGLVPLIVPVVPDHGAIIHLGDPLLQAAQWNWTIGLRRLEKANARNIVSANQIGAVQVPVILRFIESEAILHAAAPAHGQVALHHVNVDVLVEVCLICAGRWLIWLAVVLMCRCRSWSKHLGVSNW